MAIQVSGTEVISNARALNNIASVDATTVASLSAAGVGGASLSATASGTITAGKTVFFNSNGTVSQTDGVAYVAGQLQATRIDSGTFNGGSMYTEFNNAVYDSTNNKIVNIFFNSDSLSWLLSWGTPNSNGTISWNGGTTAVGSTNNITLNKSVVCGSTGKIAWIYNQNNSTNAYIRILSWNGSGYTLGTEYYLGAGFQSDMATVGWLESQSAVVITIHVASSTAWFKAATISGTNLTFGNQVTFGSSGSIGNLTNSVSVNDNIVLIPYADGNLYSFTVSGNTSTYRNNLLNQASGNRFYAAYYDPTDEFLYSIDGQRVYSYVVPDYNTITTIGNYGNTGFASGHAFGDRNSSIFKIPNTNILVAERIELGRLFVCNSTLGVFSGETVMTDITTTNTAYQYWGFPSVVYSTGVTPVRITAIYAGSSQGKSNTWSAASLPYSTAYSAFGIANSSVTNGQTANIAIANGSNTAVSGLTQGSLYYSSLTGGGLSQGAGATLLGRAISATKINMTGN